MKILMVGAGATGGYYGGMLAKAGRDVTFLLREGRAAQIRTEGLTLVRHTGEVLTLAPKIITAQELAESGPAFDVIVISTKAYQLENAMADIAPAVGPETMLLPILNGMQQLKVLSDRFGAEHVLGGSVRIMSYLDERHRIVQMLDLDQFNYGEISREQTPRILALDAVLKGAGFTANLQPDVVATMWQKWVVLASIGALCTLTRGNAGEMATTPHGPALIHAAVQECIEIARANGYPPPEDLIQTHMKRMLDPASTITSSMYRDMLGGAPVEVDHILGDLLAQAEGIATPLLTAAYVQLKLYNTRRIA